MSSALLAYYQQRAAEYERIYAKPERQSDLATLRSLLHDQLRNHHVLEVSCGTGYWTAAFAPAALSVTACDLSPEVLDIARAKPWPSANVDLIEADSYNLPDFDRKFSAAFAGFWWSHVPRHRLPAFLSGLHSKLQPGATVIFIDNRFVPDSSTPISRTSPDGDSYQLRRLDDGTTHEVLKNFPSEADLRHTLATITLATITPSPEITLTNYFWLLRYTIP
jgi:demethylmenaquinone methyltransferase/2-methoxy-6-polyprenyl-1,4-benzoquinol methylase